MTAGQPVTPPSERDGTEYTERLATRISRDVRRRLRLTAAITGQSISAILDGTLARALPTDQQLADGLRPASQTEATIAFILSGEWTPGSGDLADHCRIRAAAEARAARKMACPVCARLVQGRNDGTLAPHQRHSTAPEQFAQAGDWAWVPCEGGAPEASDER